MIRFEATLEILLCLSGALIAGLIIGWLFDSFLVGVVANIAVFCFLIDMLFSGEVEDEDDDQDY